MCFEHTHNSNNNTAPTKQKKNGMKIFARNQYKEWISLYRSYKKNGGVCLNSNVTFRPNHQHSELKEPVIVVGEL